MNPTKSTFAAALLVIASLASTAAVADTVNDMASWSLRFAEKASINVAKTGCYGTASYRYVLPRVSYVQAYRQTLRDKAAASDLSGFVFTSERNDNDEYVTVDLATGELGSIPQVGNADDVGIVMCLCDARWTQSLDNQGRPNCSPMNLPPLGETFLVEKDANRDPTDPQPPQDLWTDPVTNWTWYFASPAANWEDAMTMCAADFELPEIAVIAHAAVRMWNSHIGVRVRDADAARVWSNEEFDWYAAMAVYFPDGDAGSVNKRTLYPVLCVKR